MNKKLRLAIGICTVLAVFLLMLFRAWTESYVFCEQGRLASGVVYLRTGDFFPFHVNPPLVSLAAAVPSVVMGASFVEGNPNHFLLVFAGSYVFCLWARFAENTEIRPTAGLNAYCE